MNLMTARRGQRRPHDLGAAALDREEEKQVRSSYIQVEAELAQMEHREVLPAPPNACPLHN
jgi:hypothetical protein